MRALGADHRELALRLLVATKYGAGLVALLAPRAVFVALRSGAGTSNIPARLLGAGEIGYAARLGFARNRSRQDVLAVGMTRVLADAYVGVACAPTRAAASGCRERGRRTVPNPAGRGGAERGEGRYE